jgi:RNA polymerase sigma-70 factor (ECF subfamily)
MSIESSLSSLFLSCLSPTLQSRFSQLGQLEEVLRDIVEAGRTSWPTIALSAEVFLPYLAQRLPETGEVKRALLEIKSGDLYLACACAQGEPAAIKLFESHYLPAIKAALLRKDPSLGQIEDIKQMIYQKLLLKDNEHQPKISQYAGRGDLKSWICVIAVREAIDLMRKLKKEEPLDDNALVDKATLGEDQELQYIKKLYRTEFKTAFQTAMASLSSRERNILRHHILDGLNIDQIGVIYNVHRATVARWIARSREKLLQATRTELMQKLRINEGEFESIMRMIQSRFDVSIHHFLKRNKD